MYIIVEMCYDYGLGSDTNPYIDVMSRTFDTRSEAIEYAMNFAKCEADSLNEISERTFDCDEDGSENFDIVTRCWDGDEDYMIVTGYSVFEINKKDE